MEAANLLEEWRRTTRIDTSNISRHYAIQYDKKEFPMNGSSGISFLTHLLAKERHDIHLHLSKLGEIVIN
jgi:hypothetical protein